MSTELVDALQLFCRRKHQQANPLPSRHIAEWVIALCPLHSGGCTCVLFIPSEILRQIIKPAYQILKPPEGRSQYDPHDIERKMSRVLKPTLAKWIEASRKEKEYVFINQLRAADGIPSTYNDNPEVRAFRSFSEKLLKLKPKYLVILIRLPDDYNFAFLADLRIHRLELISCVHRRLETTLANELENCVAWFVFFQFSCLVHPTIIMRLPTLPPLHFCTTLTMFYTFLRIYKNLRMELAAPHCTEEKLNQFMHLFFDPDCEEIAIGGGSI